MRVKPRVSACVRAWVYRLQFTHVSIIVCLAQNPIKKKTGKLGGCVTWINGFRFKRLGYFLAMLGEKKVGYSPLSYSERLLTA